MENTDKRNPIAKFFGFGKKKEIIPEPENLVKEDIKTVENITEKSTKTTVPPSGRSSETPKEDIGYGIGKLDTQLQLVKTDYTLEAIPIIRKLYKVNEDLGSVLFDAIQLTNTGHNITFDNSVSSEKALKMIAHLEKVRQNWHTGSANINGLVNKWIAQIFISGALSQEWVVKMDKTGIEKNALINPETIRFAKDNRGIYTTYQKTNNLSRQYVKLNEVTYSYYSLYSDVDTPYGVPPFLTALQSLALQKDMKVNIKHILNQLGLLGYLQVTMDKPDQKANESDSAYLQRCNNLLDETKFNVGKGFKDGIVVGFEDDTQFEFNSTTKNLAGVTELFNLNENLLANGLKTSNSFLGVNSGNSESFLSIVFTKMVSQLKNTQELLIAGLKKGYELELLLAGYNPKGLKITFNPSTITDDIKIQQSMEIKQRYLRNLWSDGIIGQNQYAREMGYTTYDTKKKSPEPGIQGKGEGDQVQKEKREKDKDKSDRKGRVKEKPQPKRKDSDTKER